MSTAQSGIFALGTRRPGCRRQAWGWRHDFAAPAVGARCDGVGIPFAADPRARDRGTKTDSIELDPQPPDSHVHQTDQEMFGNVFRRNMPYGMVTGHGTMFVGFCCEQRPLQAMLESTVGLKDGVRDALTRYTRPLTRRVLLHSGGGSNPPVCNSRRSRLSIKRRCSHQQWISVHLMDVCKRNRLWIARTSKPLAGILGDVDGRIVPVAPPPVLNKASGPDRSTSPLTPRLR